MPDTEAIEAALAEERTPSPRSDNTRLSKESKHTDFKGRFDTSKAEDWCEIVKDIVAMANSGGGSIVAGIDDDGTPSAGTLSLSSP